MELESNVTIDEGVNEYGIQRQIILEGDQAVTKLTYDAAPMLEAAAAERSATAGERWGDMRKIGTIPMAELIRIQETYKTEVERKAQILLWLKANPYFVTFDKFLKTH
jgi:pyocin large subunit-like protein